MKKILSFVVVAVLAIGMLILLMQADVPCEANPKMAMNGYCDAKHQGSTK